MIPKNFESGTILNISHSLFNIYNEVYGIIPNLKGKQTETWGVSVIFQDKVLNPLLTPKAKLITIMLLTYNYIHYLFDSLGKTLK